MDSKILGIVGGGQLGRMTVDAANKLNVRTLILDAENAPAKMVHADPEHVTGKFTDPVKVRELAAKCDVLTIEIEHVDAQALAECGKPVMPEARTIALIQDKFAQKEHLAKHKLAVAYSETLEPTVDSCRAFGDAQGYPFMLKTRRDAYDGKGNSVVKSRETIEAALAELPQKGLYAEKWAPFTKELAVMVVRQLNGTVHTYPCVETKHVNNVCHTVFAPARVPEDVHAKASALAKAAVASLWGAGVFGVEMFLLPDGSLLINEIAPRPHNSGHYTMDACVTSQFEAHVRACLDMPLTEGATDFATPGTTAIMLNVLGEPEGREIDICRRALETPGSIVHLYGKSTRPGRKLGHINIIGTSMAECLNKLAYIEKNEPVGRRLPEVGVIMGSDSDLPVMSAACRVLKQFDVPFECSIVSAHRTPQKMAEYAESAETRGLKVIIAGAGGAAHLPGMVAASTTLPVIGVPVKGSSLDGVDSLYSIVQMPRGVPVAAVAINNAMNAGLLAVRTLGVGNAELRRKLDAFRQRNLEEVLAKDAHLLDVGFDEYAWKS